MMHNILSLLPASSFVPVELLKIRNVSTMWISPSRRSDIDLDKYSVMLPCQDGIQYATEPTSAVFFGERYGGTGLGFNGGGVRAVTDGQFQVKGIGSIAQLVGAETDYFHSYGGYSVSEAILESIWGEICSFALPYGAVKTIAILGTKALVPVKFPKSSGPRVTQRCLAIRDQVIRPAHFMRSSFYRSSTIKPSGYIDAIRTRNAIDVISEAFRHEFLKNNPDITQVCRSGGAENGYFEVVLELAKRAAAQIAAARARRIMHGSLTPSNSAVCGKWLDFGSISAVSDFLPIVIPRGAPDFLREHLLTKQGIRDLLAQIGTYGDFEDFNSLFHEEVQKKFDDALKERLSEEFLLLMGLTRVDIRKLNKAMLSSLYDTVESFIKKKANSPILILSTDNDVEQKMPRISRQYFLPEIFSIAGTYDDPTILDMMLCTSIPSSADRGKFIHKWILIKNSVLESIPPERHDEKLNSVAAEALRRNAPIRELYRTELYPKIDSIINEEHSVADFICAVVDRAKVVFEECRDSSNYSIILQNNKELYYMPFEGFIYQGERIDRVQAYKVQQELYRAEQ